MQGGRSAETPFYPLNEVFGARSKIKGTSINCHERHEYEADGAQKPLLSAQRDNHDAE